MIILTYNNVKILFLNKCKGVLTMNIETEKRIGKNIRALRERAGVTQEQLAAKLQTNGCDITRSAVAKIEVGQRHIYADEIILISEILRASFDEILDIK